MPFHTGLPASRFMYAQASNGSVACITGTITIICTIILVMQVNEAYNNLYGAENTLSFDSSYISSEEHQYIKQLHSEMQYQQWLYPLLAILECCCMAGIFVVARMMVADRNFFGLQAFCVTEGVCSALCCLLAVGSCVGFLYFADQATKLNDPNTYCDSLNFSVSSTADQDNCKKWADALQVPRMTQAFFSFFMFLGGLCYCSSCGAGSKFAYDTQEALEMEAYGMAGYGGYGMREFY